MTDMRLGTLIKNTVFTFILTAVLYPRPICSWLNSGISCQFWPPVFGLILIFFSILDFGVVLLISISTTFIYFKLNSEKLPLLRKIRNENLRNILLFLAIWIILMAVFSLPYYLYGRYISSTGVIE